MRRTRSITDPILVVMDDEARRWEIQQRLGRAGYSSVIAAAATEALNILNERAEVPATILLDTHVSETMVRALLTVLAATPALAGVPIFFISPKEGLPAALLS